MYEDGGDKAEKFIALEKALLAIPPSSVEAEHAFSAPGLFTTKFHAQMRPQTLNMACFVRAYYKNNDR